MKFERLYLAKINEFEKIPCFINEIDLCKIPNAL